MTRDFYQTLLFMNIRVLISQKKNVPLLEIIECFGEVILKVSLSSNSLEKFYYINGNHFGQQYKEHLSDYKDWDQRTHAEQWMVFPENIGTHLSLDETSLSDGEYTEVPDFTASPFTYFTFSVNLPSTGFPSLSVPQTRFRVSVRGHVPSVVYSERNPPISSVANFGVEPIYPPLGRRIIPK